MSGLYDDLSDRAALERHLAVNFFGPYDMTQAFLPQLTRSHGAAGQRAVDRLPGGAADHPVLLGLQGGGVLASPSPCGPSWPGEGVSVHAVLVGPTDTEMSRGFEVPKVSAEYAARAIFDGVEQGEEDIFPHPMLEAAGEGWRTGEIKGLERQFATLVQAVPLAS